MSITNGYCTLAEAKTQLGIATLDTVDDAELERIITAVSREIDDFCGRRFYAATQTRYYTARRGDRLVVDDLLSVSALVTDDDADGTYETTWLATDYALEPANAQLESVPEPYWRIEVTPYASYSFPCGVPRGVKVTGSFGFSSTTPDVVKTACLFQVALELRLQDAPLGTVGEGDTSRQVRLTGLHPKTKQMLSTGPYVRTTVA